MEIRLVDGSKQNHFASFCYQKQDEWKCVWRICQRVFEVQFVAGYPTLHIEL
jgi:hypothetical protein